MNFDDVDDDGEVDSERLPRDETRTLRTGGKDRPLARRLIEQAWERQELSRSLADFDDYVV